MFNILKEWFNIDYDYQSGVYRNIIDWDAAKCYKDWKNDLYNLFKKVSSELPPNLQDICHWQQCCDRFISDKF